MQLSADLAKLGTPWERYRFLPGLRAGRSRNQLPMSSWALVLVYHRLWDWRRLLSREIRSWSSLTSLRGEHYNITVLNFNTIFVVNKCRGIEWSCFFQFTTPPSGRSDIYLLRQKAAHTIKQTNTLQKNYRKRDRWVINDKIWSNFKWHPNFYQCDFLSNIFRFSILRRMTALSLFWVFHSIWWTNLPIGIGHAHNFSRHIASHTAVID
jgi:hypothetical protein